MPDLDASRLNHAVRANGSAPPTVDFELQYDAAAMVFLYPHESKLMRTVTVKNKGGYAMLQAGAAVSAPGRPAINVELLPQPSIPVMPGGFYLEPGESQLIWVTVYLESVDQAEWQPGQSYDYEIDVYVFPQRGPFDPSVVQPGTQIAKLPNTVRVIDRRDGRNVPRNVTIAGCVYDAATRRPLANAQIEFASGRFVPVVSTTTDAAGSYSVGLIAHRGALTGMWLTWGVTVKAPGYREFHGAVAPQDGDRLVVHAALAKATETASYALKAKIDTGGLNVNRGAISRNGQFAAMVHFHSTLPPGADGQQFLGRAQLSFFDTSGVLLWQFPLYAETPAVAVSDDGSLVATARGSACCRYQQRSDSGVYLLDNRGNVVWYFHDPAAPALAFQEVRISHSKQYLAAGDLSGRIYLLDSDSRKIVWQRFVGGVVREIRFTEDDGGLIVGSGDGYLYAFAIDGAVESRTYIGGFPIAFAFSQHYVMAAGKEGHFVALLERSGRVLWEYPIPAAPQAVFIAPDESYMVAVGNGSAFRTLVFDPSGVVRYQLDAAQVSFISADSEHTLRAAFQGLPNQLRTIWLEVTDGLGNVLWRNDAVGTTEQGGAGGFMWMSDDARRIVLAYGEWAFFFEGSISPK